MSDALTNIQTVLNLFQGEIIMNNIGQERIDTAVRNILSGNNNCGTLKNAVDTGNGTYFYNAIAPIAAVYASELEDMTKQRNELSIDNERKRFALESIISNMSPNDFPDSVARVIMQAMPGRHW